MAEFGLVEPFDIDDGQPLGNTPQEAFVLGYELATVHKALESSGEYLSPVHADNRERIAKACEKSGRAFRLTWMTGDISEDWMQLWVEAKKAKGET